MPAKAIFKICGKKDWEACQVTGTLPLAPIDESDGYVHLSGKEDVQGTLDLYFKGVTDLIVLEFDTDFLGAGLECKGEAPHDGSRADRSFPHVYGGPLQGPTVKAAHKVASSADGNNVVQWAE